MSRYLGLIWDCDEEVLEISDPPLPPEYEGRRFDDGVPVRSLAELRGCRRTALASSTSKTLRAAQRLQAMRESAKQRRDSHRQKNRDRLAMLAGMTPKQYADRRREQNRLNKRAERQARRSTPLPDKDGRPPVPVWWGRAWFPSQSDLMASLGVRKSGSFRESLRRGWYRGKPLIRDGPGAQELAEELSDRADHRCRPVVYEGKPYPSVKSLAKATGLTKRRIEYALEFGGLLRGAQVLDGRAA